MQRSFGTYPILSKRWLVKVMSFKILNWKLLTKVSDEVDLTIRKALETVVSSRTNFSFYFEKPLETLAFFEISNS